MRLIQERFVFFLPPVCVVILALMFMGTAWGAPLSDELDTYDTAKWYEADGWMSPGECIWNRNNISFSDGIMSLALNDTAYDGEPYSCAQYQSTGTYGYGKYSARFKSAPGTGVVTGFFVYDESQGSGHQDEIDVEILDSPYDGVDAPQLQVNYFKDGDGNHEEMIALGFDPSAAYHLYAFEWTETSINWYVDGVLVHTVSGTASTLPTRVGKIMMNLWNPGSDEWVGPFDYVEPSVAAFQSVWWKGPRRRL